MTRYYYYLVLICMIINTMLFVPVIMFKYRFEGAVSSIPVAIVSGTICSYLFTTAMRKYPKLGLPEILVQRKWKSWLRIPFLLYLGIMWFVAGGIAIVGFSRVVQRYLNPDLNIFMIAIFFFAICAYIASSNSKSVLFATEVILVLNVPFIGFILLKALSNEYISWDAIITVAHYWRHPPSISSLSACTYIFTGYVNLAIFNRCFGEERKLKFRWLIVIGAIGVLTTTFFIPIGLFGTMAVDDFVYIWATAADSLRMEFGIIERLLFIYLLLYLSITLIFSTVVLHVSLELFKGAFAMKDPEKHPSKTKLGISQGKWVSIVGLASMCAIILWVIRSYNEKEFIQLTEHWLQLRYASELFLVGVVFYLGMRKRAA